MIRPTLAVAAAALIPLATLPQADKRIGPLGPNPTDGIRLATGAVITPAGSHQITGDMIQTAEVSPDGKNIAMNCGGAAAHRILLLDPATGLIRQSIPVGRTQGTGLAWAPDSRTLYANGGNSGRIHVLKIDDNGRAVEGTPITLDGTGSFQSGLTVSPDGTRLLVADVAVPTLRLIDPSTGKEVTRRALKRRERPGVLRWAPDGKTVLVADWGSDKVHIVDAVSLESLKTIKAGGHPNDIRIAGDRVFVSCGNADQVVVFDRQSGTVSERIHTALTPKAPIGATPSAIAVAPDGKTLYVANSDTNSIMVVDVAEPGKSEPEGFIPTAHYPTAVAVSPDGKRLLVGCGKGLGTGPNPPPASEKGTARPTYPYIATLLKGVVSTVALPNRTQLATYTKQVYANNPYSSDSFRETPANAPKPGNSIVPSKVGRQSPIRHVLYIIKENRTYDQVFGDMEKGDGDKDLAIYGEEVTPNHHALAREYVLFDNFFANGEVSVDGHHWSNAAYVPDSMQRLWHAQYGAKGSPPIRYGDFNDPLANTPAPRLWDRAAENGLSFRTYYYHTDKNRSDEWADARAKGVRDHVAADIFLRDLDRWETEGNLPNLMVMALSEDHTKGLTPGANTPQACVASNDLALGKIVEACSKSKFWKEMAIFVVEDDAQNGPDHVDAHRTVALVISPYTRRAGMLDSTFYNTTSMLRTIELLLGLGPMSPFDAAATPMSRAFGTKPDTTPFRCRDARIDLNAVNPSKSALAAMSKHLDFSAPDRLTVDDEQLLNRVLWHQAKGMHSPYPGLVRRPWFWPNGRPKTGEGDD